MYGFENQWIAAAPLYLSLSLYICIYVAASIYPYVLISLNS